KERRDRRWIVIGRRDLDCTFVEACRSHFHWNARRFKELVPHRAPRRQHQRGGGEPKPHHATGCRRRSDKSLSTAAPGSSIERRGTSISGQLCFAHSPRDKALSSVTASRAT